MPEQTCDISLILLAEKGSTCSSAFLSGLRSWLQSQGISYEILVAGAESDLNRPDGFGEKDYIALAAGSYGDVLRAACQKAAGTYILSLDAGLDENLEVISRLWQARGTAEILIGSRYMPEGAATMPGPRWLLSRALNGAFSRGLDLHVRDMSSAFRLYKSHVIKGLATESRDYDILQEILVKALMMGYEIREIPFRYRSSDPAYGRTFRFGLAYWKTFARLWKQRNSIASADYDARAYNALMPPQRYWQRQRYRHIKEMIHKNEDPRCLDVGCGSSRIISTLPPGSLALDILLRKLRYARRYGHATVQGSIFALPVPTGSFPCVLCSQVIEHVPRANVLDELDRALEPGGLLILGTPDYANWQWLVIEWLYKVLLPQAYADEHITHYTYQELVGEFVSKRGYTLEGTKYILKGELILALRKPGHLKKE